MIRRQTTYICGWQAFCSVCVCGVVCCCCQRGAREHTCPFKNRYLCSFCHPNHNINTTRSAELQKGTKLFSPPHSPNQQHQRKGEHSGNGRSTFHPTKLLFKTTAVALCMTRTPVMTTRYVSGELAKQTYLLIYRQNHKGERPSGRS